MAEKELLSIIIPCYNEEEGIPQLKEQLAPVVESLHSRYDVEVVFVDDGSKDRTYDLLMKYYDHMPLVKIVRHEQNQNLGAALKTGFKNAKGSLLATWDSDCTYPPSLLPQMLELLDDTTDIVTVSPYHPQGEVNNVPAYRLFLSKGAARVYRFLLRSNIYTPGAMVRVYRKKVIDTVQSNATNFLFVPEFLIKACLQGYTIKELPTILNVRQYGTSKMKLASTILSHSKLMGKIVLYKTLGRKL